MGSVAAFRPETYLPEGDQVGEIYRFLHSRGAGHDQAAPRYFLTESPAGEQVEVPAEIYRALHQVVDALQRGHAVTVAPVTQTLTTQQAADLLGVSRPTVIKLLDEGRISFERNGTHRRIALRDLLSYREQRRTEQYAALEATSVNVDDEEDIDVALLRLREVRTALAAQRRAARGS